VDSFVAATSWGDEEFDDQQVDDFGPQKSQDGGFSIGIQPGATMGGFFIEQRPMLADDIESRVNNDSYACMSSLGNVSPQSNNKSSFSFSFSAWASVSAVPVLDHRNSSFGSQEIAPRDWELPDGEDVLKIVPESKKHQKNYQKKPAVAPSRPKRKEISPTEFAVPESWSEGRVSVLSSHLPGSVPKPAATAPPTKKQKRTTVKKEDWKPDMIDLTDPEIHRLKEAINDKSPETIYLLEADSIKDKKISPLLRALLFAPELPEGFLLVMAKSSFFAPACSACSVVFPGKMKDTKQRVLLRKSLQQPLGMTPSEFYAHAISKLVVAVPGKTVSLAVLTGDKKTTFKWTSQMPKQTIKPVLVDISGTEETVGDYCPKSMHPPSVIPTLNAAVSTFLTSRKLPSGDEQDFLNTLSRSDSSEARRVSAVAYAALAEERSVQKAVARTRDWILSREGEGSLPASRSALSNSIAKTHCKVKEATDAHAIIRWLFQEGISRVCTTCGNLALKHGEEITSLLPRDKWEANQKFGVEIADTVMKVLRYLESPKVSVPTSFTGLQSTVEGFCSQYRFVPSSKVVDRLYTLGMVQDASEIDMHTAGASAYLSRDKRAMVYNWENLHNLVLEVDEELPEDIYEDEEQHLDDDADLAIDDPMDE
jgi:hypothetical protein